MKREQRLSGGSRRRAEGPTRTGAWLCAGLLLLPLPCLAAITTATTTPPGTESESSASSALARGVALFAERAWEPALVELRRAAEDPGLRDDAELLLGICYYRLSRFTEAEALLRLSTSRGDREAQAAARLFLGRLFAGQGALDQARSELDAAARAPGMQGAAQRLLEQERPQRLQLTLLAAPEFDGNVPLTSYSDWQQSPAASSDGDLLLVGSLSVRPSSFGLSLGNTLAYRAQFRLTQYSLLVNSTWLGYSYLGSRDRLRLGVSLNYSMLGGASLFVDGDAKVQYRRGLRGELGLSVGYEARYRGYLNADYAPLSGLTQSLELALGWAVRPSPLTASLGYQVIREQLPPTVAVTDPTYVDYRAWAHGPLLRLRARLHPRLELGLQASLLQRYFDYLPGPELPAEQGIRRIDYAVAGELSLTVHLTRWLDGFFAQSLLENASNKAPYEFFKPTTSLGLACLLGFL